MWATSAATYTKRSTPTRRFPALAMSIPDGPFITYTDSSNSLLNTATALTPITTGLQTKLQKQLSHGLDFLLTYTWSKALTTTEGGGVPTNSYNVQSDYGPASWDRAQTLTFEHNWNLPFGRDRYWKLGNNAVANIVAGGWRLSGVHTVASGEPFTPECRQRAAPERPDFAGLRADVVGNWHVPIQTPANGSIPPPLPSRSSPIAKAPPAATPCAARAFGNPTSHSPRTCSPVSAAPSNSAPTPSTYSTTKISPSPTPPSMSAEPARSPPSKCPCAKCNSACTSSSKKKGTFRTVVSVALDRAL